MAELSFVISPQLHCPYCGTQVRADTDWVVAAQQHWGWCGVQVLVAGEIAGVLLLTPQGSHEALLKTLWVLQPQRGLGKRLVQSACAGLLFRDVRTILSPGTSANFTCQLPPSRFLRRTGFAHPMDEPFYRLDLKSIVTEKSTAQLLVERLVRGFQPPTPEAATSTSNSEVTS